MTDEVVYITVEWDAEPDDKDAPTDAPIPVPYNVWQYRDQHPSGDGVAYWLTDNYEYLVTSWRRVA